MVGGCHVLPPWHSTVPRVSTRTEAELGNGIAKATLSPKSSRTCVHLPSSLPSTLRFPSLESHESVM